MVNSLEFVQNRIKSGFCKNMNIDKFENAYQQSFNDYIKVCSEDVQKCYKDNTFNISLECDTKKVKIEIVYDPEADYEYFTMESCKCDGTLVFYLELMEKILHKLFGIKTYNIQTAPKDIVENIWDYNVKYTVGDFVLNDEYGEQFSTKEKPWMLSRFTVMLPIKCEFIKKQPNKT